jgi:hypothetical protein
MKLKNIIPAFLQKAGLDQYIGINKNNAICQVLINDGEIKTEFSITNFISFFSPENCAENEKFRISIIADGFNSSKIVSLPKFGSKAIKPEEEFGKKIPDIGLFTVEYLSPINYKNKNRDLGLLNSHFYSMYHTADNSSIALIHPQQFLSDQRYKKTKPYAWNSQYIFNTENVSEIHIYQSNVLKAWDMNSGCSIIDARTNEIIDVSEYEMKSKTVKKTVFNIKKIRDQVPQIKLGVKALCGDNAKPLAFVYSDDGSFTATHC